MSTTKDDTTDGKWIYRPYVTIRGKRVYPKNAKVFRFWVENEQ